MVWSVIVRCGNGREKKRPPLFDKTAAAFARSADIKKRCQTIDRANTRQIAEGTKTSRLILEQSPRQGGIRWGSWQEIGQLPFWWGRWFTRLLSFSDRQCRRSPLEFCVCPQELTAGIKFPCVTSDLRDWIKYEAEVYLHFTPWWNNLY